MVDGQHDADDVDGDPEEVDDVVSGKGVDQCDYRTTGVNILIILTPILVMMRYRKGPWTSGHDGSLGL